MANIHPFQAVHPEPNNVQKIASLPYDVMSRSEAEEMAGNNDLNFLHVTRSEIDLPESVDPYDQQVYAKAKENYQALKSSGALQKDDTPALYIYALTWQGHTQTGIVAAASVDDYDNDVIKKHEKTRQAKEDDRTSHIVKTRAQTGPVFLTYRDRNSVDELVRKATEEQPLFNFTAEDDVEHTVWKVSEDLTKRLVSEFDKIDNLYIADGHHRAASASRAREEMAKTEGDDKNASYNRFLSVIFPAGQLQILPYNRTVKDLNGYTSESFLDALRDVMTVSKTDKTAPEKPLAFNMYLNGQWWQLSYEKSVEGLSVADRLDVAILQNNVLEPLLNITDPRTNDRIDFIGGIRGTKELEKLVDSGDAQVAFSMYPTTVEQLIEISDAGEIMPPKSTWFEPKLRDGLFVHEI